MKVQELLIEELERLKQKYNNQEEPVICYSICDASHDLYIDDSIDDRETLKVDNLLREHFKTINVGYIFDTAYDEEPTKVTLHPHGQHKSCGTFHWEVDDIDSRVQWIKDNINF